MDLHLTSLETVELIIELEIAYGVTIPCVDKKQNLHQLATLCESSPKTCPSLCDQPLLHASRTLPTQGYYCDNYFKYHILRDAVSITLLFPEDVSAASIREGLWRLLNDVPSLHCRLAEQEGEIWQFDSDLPADVTHFELPASATPHLSADFDFAQGKLFYYQLHQDRQGNLLTLHIAHVIADGFACKVLIGWLLQLIEQDSAPPVKNLHQYASLVWQTMPVDLEPLRQFWAVQGSIARPKLLFGNIPVAIPPGEVSGSISRLMCDYLPVGIINRHIVERGISLHAFVSYAVWRLQQRICPDPRLEFHSPVGNRDSGNSAVIANLIKIVPFSIELDVELPTFAQLLQMQQAIVLSIANCQLSWGEIASLTQRPRIGLIVAESPKPFHDSQRGVKEYYSPAPVIAKNALSFFYCSLKDGLKVDLRYNLSVANEAFIHHLRDRFNQELINIISELTEMGEKA